MMASSTQRESKSIHLASSWKYDVFLSFSGKETRKTFTGHLHKALKGKRIIKVFKDDQQLEAGSTIFKELLTAIEESKFAIVVISQDYASSKWCLDELVKIVECMEKRETILPIFYNVDQSDVRHQRGTFGEAFIKHGKDIHDTEMVQRWKTALTKVGGMSGWDLARYHEQAKFIEDIVDELYNKLVCAGCNKRVDDGLKFLGTVWHQACLLCKRCNDPCTDEDCTEYGDHPYHKRCYELLCKACIVCKEPIKVNSEGQDEYKEHPLWRQRYCPSHMKDGTLRCCSCERLKPRDTTYYKLDENQKPKRGIIRTDTCRFIRFIINLRRNRRGALSGLIPADLSDISSSFEETEAGSSRRRVSDHDVATECFSNDESTIVDVETAMRTTEKNRITSLRHPNLVQLRGRGQDGVTTVLCQ